jgi:hypothetical protein
MSREDIFIAHFKIQKKCVMEVKTKIETYKNTLKGVKRQTEMKKKI